MKKWNVISGSGPLPAYGKVLHLYLPFLLFCLCVMAGRPVCGMAAANGGGGEIILSTISLRYRMIGLCDTKHDISGVW